MVTDLVLFLCDIAALVSAATLLGIAMAQLVQPRVDFWPPPTPKSWQSHTFRALFRVVVYGSVISSAAWLWESGGTVLLWTAALSAVLIALGFGIAFAATGFLGWGNAFGAQDGLRTTGVFSRSRNPIYVATLLGLLGWGLIVQDLSVRITLILWSLLYFAGVFLEERWLSARYGSAFDDYRARVRRFL